MLDIDFARFLAERKQDAAASKREVRQKLRRGSLDGFHLGLGDKAPPA